MFNVTSAPQRINFNLKNYNYWSRDNAEANLIMRAQDQMLDLENVGGPGSWSQLMRLLMNGFHSNIT